MLEIAALWKNTDKNGVVYLSGTLGNSKLLVLANKHKKEGSKEPDFRVLVCEKPKKEGEAQPSVATESWVGGYTQGYGEKTNPFPGRV